MWLSARCQEEFLPPRSVTRSVPSSKTSIGRPFLAEKQPEEQQLGLEEPRPYQLQAFRQAFGDWKNCSGGKRVSRTPL